MGRYVGVGGRYVSGGYVGGIVKWDQIFSN